MKDRHVLSYLIVDPLQSEHSNRVKELPEQVCVLDTYFDVCTCTFCLTRQFDEATISEEEAKNNEKRKGIMKIS